MRDAIGARRGLRPIRSIRGRPEVLEHFANGPFMTVMDIVEDRGATLDEAIGQLDMWVADGRVKPLHDGLRQWTSHAAAAYREVFQRPDSPATQPVRLAWTFRRHLTSADARGAQLYEIGVWGRCYTSRDGRFRELRLIRNHLREHSPTDDTVAVAAFVLARAIPDDKVRSVRITQFGVTEGIAETLFDGSTESAVELYQANGRRSLGALVDSQEYRPGAGCADCVCAGVCPTLPRAPGLLGIAGDNRPRRSWSPTNARQYRACPAREHLHRQFLPADPNIERSPAAERGRAVHAFLAHRHEAGPGHPCDVRVPVDWPDERHPLAEHDRQLGARLLRHHAEVCPSGIAANIRTEPDLVFEDATAGVVVLAKPDLLYQDHTGAWVWREVKTSASDRRCVTDPLVEYPQVALGVALLARGVFGGGRGRLELEVLRPGGVDLLTLDPFTATVRAAAERTLSENLAPWRADDWFAATPGVECARCEVGHWCSQRGTASERPEENK